MCHKDVHFFIHLDKKWKISDGDYDLIKNANSNVHILKNRISTFLDHWSLTEAVLQLIDLARITVGGGILPYAPDKTIRLSQLSSF
jgi:hypothetical protein